MFFKFFLHNFIIKISSLYIIFLSAGLGLALTAPRIKNARTNYKTNMGRTEKMKKALQNQIDKETQEETKQLQIQDTSCPLSSLYSELAFDSEDKFEQLYANLTDHQRKVYFRQILKQNIKLEENINKSKPTPLKENQDLPDIQGEKEFVNNDDKNELTRFILYPEREYKATSLSQMHFRLAESQFFRLEDDDKNYRVTKVEYIVNPVLVKKFREAQENLRQTRGEEYSHPVLAFHGTSEDSIASIVRTGFHMPGDLGFKQANDSGWYGRGIYLSEYPSYAREYMNRGGVSSKLLLCQVLIGKVFHCKERIDGEQLKKGFDSHLSPAMHQLIIFNSHHVLPSYIVHFEVSRGDFRYKKTSSL